MTRPSLAAGPAADRRRDLDDRPCRERGHQSDAGHQFRSAHSARRHGRVGRSAVERPLRRLFAIVHAPRRRSASNPARFHPPKQEGDHAHGASHAIRPPVTRPALADGGDAAGHAVDRRLDGGLVGRLPPPSGHPSAARHRDLDAGGHPADQSTAHHAPAVSSDDVSVGTIGRFVVREATLCPDARLAARGLGHAVGRALSDRHVRPDTPAAYSSRPSSALQHRCAGRTRCLRFSSLRPFSPTSVPCCSTR